MPFSCSPIRLAENDLELQMYGLWTNRNALKDFFQGALYERSDSVSDIYIAVAFFTEVDVVKELLRGQCNIRLIVRLGFPTNPKALQVLLDNTNIDIRFYTGHSFHPKLYIFGDDEAFIGSANLTRAALLANQEIMISIGSEDPRFEELTSLFSEYWNEAQVLTSEILREYEEIYGKYNASIKELSNIDDDVIKNIGKIEFPNIERGEKKKTKENIFIDKYSKAYQESVSAFAKIKDVYSSFNKRKVSNVDLPLRLEIDSFFSYIRDTHATGDRWKETSIGWTNDSKRRLREHIKEWLHTTWLHYDEDICQTNYPLITRVFGSVDSVVAADYNEIIQALTVLHSFHDRLRFFPGGLSSLMDAFRTSNDIDSIKKSITYLLYGQGDVVERMANLIYDRRYKINEFGQSNVQELVGWINREDLPVINGRTTKILRYYGFNVRQL